jgi:hypothetical protein
VAEHAVKPIGWLALLAAGVILYGIGHRDGRFSVEEEQRAQKRKEAKAVAFSSEVIHLRQVGVSESSKRAVAASQVRAAAIAQSRVVEVAAADSSRDELDALRAVLPTLFDTRDSLRVRTQMLRSAEQEAAHLRTALERSEDEKREINAQRDSARFDRDRWEMDAIKLHDSQILLVKALDAEVAAHTCRIGAGILSIGCPSRKVVAIGAFVLGAGAVLHFTHPRERDNPPD